MSDNSTFYSVLSNARAREADEAIAAANDWRQYGEQMARSLIQMNIMRDMLLDELERVSGAWYYDRLNTFEKRVEHYRRLDNQVDEYAKRLGITAYQRQPSRSPEAVAVDRMEKAGLPVTDDQRRIARDADRQLCAGRKNRPSKVKLVWSWIKLVASLCILAGVSLSVWIGFHPLGPVKEAVFGLLYKLFPGA